VVAERHPPDRQLALPPAGGERLLQPALRPVVLEVVDPLLGAPRRVDAHDLEQPADPEGVEEPRIHGGPRRGDARAEPGVEVEVVEQLLAVVARLLVGAVVVAGSRVHGQVVDEVPVRLVEGEVPVVVLVARLGGGVLLPVVDVVAQRDQEAHGVRRRQRLEGPGHALLPAPVGVVGDADPVVAEGEERDRLGHVVSRMRPEPEVVGAVRRRGTTLVELPVPALAGRPQHAVDQHAVAVLGVGFEALDPRMVLVGRGARRHDLALVVEHLDEAFAVRWGLRADGPAAPAVPACQLVVVHHDPATVELLEEEPSPGHEHRRVGQVDQVDEALEATVG
jgi:hypothetical protein